MKKKQVQNQAQQGRSMVEMLGVLAVIGVISLGGISGYRMAMNRYQANQIANEINLMRTDAKMKAAMKAAQGTGKLMLGEPYDSGHLNFGSNYAVDFDFIDIKSEDEGVTEAGYYIKISGISAGVCKPLVTLLNGMNETVALKVNEVEYSADSSTDFCTEESNNALEVDFSTEKIISTSGEEPPEEQGDEPQDEPVCDDETCAGGECQADGTCKCNDENEYWTGYGCTACPEGARQEDGTCECTEESHLKGSACITCPEEAPWSDAVDDCVCKDAGKYWTSDGKCIDNVCNSGQPCSDDEGGDPKYCDMSGISCDNGVPSASRGTCTPVTDSSYSKVEVENSAGGKKTIYVSKSNNFDWWAADAFCRALGRKLGKPMHLVSLGDLGCIWGNGCPTGSYGKSLVSKGLNGLGWTSTPYNHDNTSCRADGVDLNRGSVHYLYRDDDYYYALCE